MAGPRTISGGGEESEAGEGKAVKGEEGGRGGPL